MHKLRTVVASPNPFPYNRIVQWAAGPVSVAVGLAFGWIGVHLHVVIPNTVHDTVVQTVAGTVLAAIGAGLTYLAHHKWFNNLEKWLEHNVPSPTVVNNAQAEDPKSPGVV